MDLKKNGGNATLSALIISVKSALQLQLTAMVKFALLRYLSEFRLRVSSF